MKEGIVRAADALQQPYILAAYVVMLLVLAWCNAQGSEQLLALYKGGFGIRASRQMEREELTMKPAVFFFMVLFALASIGLFGYQAGVQAGKLAPERNTFLLVLSGSVGLMLLVLGFQALVFWLLGAVQKGTVIARFGVVQVVLLGSLLLPISLLMTFAPLPRMPLVIAGCVLVGLLFSYRWLKGLFLGRSIGISVLHIVLYLCAAEILPVVIGVRKLGVLNLLSW